MSKKYLQTSIYDFSLESGVPVTKKFCGDLVEFVQKAIEKEVVKQGKFNFAGFGSLNLVTRKSRMLKDIRTKQPIRVPEMKAIRFQISKNFKEDLNKKHD